MDLNNIAFYVVNTRDTGSIEMRYQARLLEPNAIGTVGIYFPYKMDMITNSTGWQKLETDSETAFMKKYACINKTICRIDFFEELAFLKN